MRIFTMILIIFICFFGGMMYGSFEMKQEQTDVSASPEGEAMQMEPFQPEEMEEVAFSEADGKASLGEDLPLVHRVAASFEKVVVFIYGLFLKMLYMIADAFF